jgi:hypothetical protein
MAQHKWHKEILAWANGAEIQSQNWKDAVWHDIKKPNWDGFAYRIKPQPKEPQYLYVYESLQKEIPVIRSETSTVYKNLLGKIKLEEN